MTLTKNVCTQGSKCDKRKLTGPRSEENQECYGQRKAICLFSAISSLGIIMLSGCIFVLELARIPPAFSSFHGPQSQERGPARQEEQVLIQ